MTCIANDIGHGRTTLDQRLWLLSAGRRLRENEASLGRSRYRKLVSVSVRDDNMTCCCVRLPTPAYLQRLHRRSRRPADRKPTTVRYRGRTSQQCLTHGSGPPPRGSKATGPTDPWLKGILRRNSHKGCHLLLSLSRAVSELAVNIGARTVAVACGPLPRAFGALTGVAGSATQSEAVSTQGRSIRRATFASAHRQARGSTSSMSAGTGPALPGLREALLDRTATESGLSGLWWRAS